MASGRFCARAGCGTPALALLSFDYESRAAWLDDPPGGAEVAGYDLCATHADRLTVPRGWVLEDRRSVVRALPERRIAV